MKNKRRFPILLTSVLMGIVLLLTGYVGAYYATVRPGSGILPRGVYPPVLEIQPVYTPSRILRIEVEFLFDPIHQLDCRLRPKTWRRPYTPPFDYM